MQFQNALRPLGAASIALALAPFALLAPARAQCDGAWAPGGPVNGISGSAVAMIKWDPDGAGPAPELVVVGGKFTVAGAVLANNVAAYNPQTGQWSALGAGIPGNTNANVRDLALLPNASGGSDLIAAGQFNSQTGSTGYNNVARFDGTAWVPMGAGLNRMSNGDAAVCLLVVPDGAGGHDVIAGGAFTGSGSTPLNNLARWRDGAWTSFNGGVNGALLPKVLSLATVPNPQSTGGVDVVVGGRFTTAGTVAANGLARWDGTAWSAYYTTASGNASGTFGIYTILVLPNGSGGHDLMVGGEFAGFDGVTANNIARWNGAAWAPVGSGRPAIVSNLHLFPSGPEGQMEVIAADSQFNLSVEHVTRFNGTTWQNIGFGTNAYASCFLNVGNELFIGGSFQKPGGVWAQGVTRWNGAAYAATCTGTNVTTHTLMTTPSPQETTDLYVGGIEGTFAAGPTAGVGRRDGDAWSPVGTPLISGAIGTTTRAILMRTGAQGQPLLTVGGTYGVKQWEGEAWTSLGNLGDPTHALCTFPDAQGTRQLLAAAGTGVWSFSGTNWTRMGTGGPTAYALITKLSAGGVEELYSGGSSSTNVRRWTGTAWATVGLGLNGDVRALAVLPDGAGGSSLIAGGDFSTSGSTTLNFIARWNGTAWVPLGSGMNGGVRALDVVPNPSGGYTLVAGGVFTTAGGVPASYIAQWNGSAWSAMGSGLNNSVLALAHRPASDGGMDIFVGGTFTSAGPHASAYTARWHTPPSADIGGPGGEPGRDGQLDNNDFIVFINRFFELNPAADRGTAGGLPGADGQFDNNDFIVFINQFFAGC